MRESQNPPAYARSYIPSEFQEAIDVAGCALDEQLEQLHRSYAAASRAASKSRFELELLESRDDVQAHVITHSKRQNAAAETRAAQLLRQIDALEDRLEDA